MPKAVGHRLRHNPHADAITDHFAKTVKVAHSDAIVQVVTEFGGMLTDVFLKLNSLPGHRYGGSSDVCGR